MPRERRDALPCVVAIGGLDPGGGAGLAADLRAIAATGAFGCAVASLVTVQSTAGVRAVRPLDAPLLRAQIEEVLRHQRVRAVKVGALGSAANVRTVARLLERIGGRTALPVVVDTPIRPSRGERARLTSDEAVSALARDLLPRATLLTVNAAEAQILLGEPVRTVADAREAARALARRGARAVLVKGGHLAGPRAIDVLAVGSEVVELRARRVPALDAHGTGCTFASLVAGRLATRGDDDVDGEAVVGAVRWAKRVHHAALCRAVRVGDGMRVLTF
jgi:hydroxymethylpyrimidine/phosphomethylpyrimidine kinase